MNAALRHLTDEVRKLRHELRGGENDQSHKPLRRGRTIPVDTERRLHLVPPQKRRA